MNNRKLSDISDNESSVLKVRKFNTDSFEQDCLNFIIQVPSLQTIAIVNIVANLWKHADFRIKVFEHLSEYYYGSRSKFLARSKHFDQLSENVFVKVSLLTLPNLLTEILKHFISPIGKEMINWLGSFERDYWNCNSEFESIDYLCWTMNGTVDKAKTLQLSLEKKNLLPIFNKACECCLEVHIANLWEQIPKETKESNFYCRSMYLNCKHHLIAYWICCMKNELSKLYQMFTQRDLNIYNDKHSIYKNMCTLCVSEGKALAAKYFWNKLTDEERNDYKTDWTCLAIKRQERNIHSVNNNEYTDIICFLLSQMADKHQQREVFRKHSGVVFLKSLFLVWRWQTFLLPTIQLMWDFLDHKVYNCILSTIIYTFNKRTTAEKRFKELWTKSPINLKKHFIQHFINQRLINVVWNFENEDITPVKLILNDANVGEKVQIFSTIQSQKILKLIEINKLSLFEVLMGESMMSESEIKMIKNNLLIGHGDAICCECIREDNLQAIGKILDWGFDSQDSQEVRTTLQTKIVNRIKEDSSFRILGAANWSSFERFIDWCFNSDEEIDQFKMVISPYGKMECFIYNILRCDYNFNFAENLLFWCYSSLKKIDEFKIGFMLSNKGLDMYIKCLNNYGVENSKYSHWELVEQLTRWFHPFEKKVLVEFKDKFKVEFLNFHCQMINNIDAELEGFFLLLDSFICEYEISDSSHTSSDCNCSDKSSDCDCSDKSSDCSDESCGSDSSFIYRSDENWFNNSSGSFFKENHFDCSNCQLNESDSSNDCSSTCSPDHDDAILLMGEVINDEYENCDYKGEIISLLDELLDKVDHIL